LEVGQDKESLEVQTACLSTATARRAERKRRVNPRLEQESPFLFATKSLVLLSTTEPMST
jgi:hypothetical protein